MWPCAGHGVGLGEVLEVPGATGGALLTDRPTGCSLGAMGSGLNWALTDLN